MTPGLKRLLDGLTPDQRALVESALPDIVTRLAALDDRRLANRVDVADLLAEAMLTAGKAVADAGEKRIAESFIVSATDKAEAARLADLLGVTCGRP